MTYKLHIRKTTVVVEYFGTATCGMLVDLRKSYNGNISAARTAGLQRVLSNKETVNAYIIFGKGLIGRNTVM